MAREKRLKKTLNFKRERAPGGAAGVKLGPEKEREK